MADELSKLQAFEQKVDSPMVDIKWLSLKRGLKNYYRTYHLFTKEEFYFPNPFPHGDENSSDSAGYVESYANCIIGFHHFFELYLKGILHEIDPLLAVEHRYFQKEIGIIAFLNSDKNLRDFLEPQELHTPSFSDVMARLKRLWNKKGELKTELQIPENYKPLFKDDSHWKSLRKLAELRNSLAHQGDKVLGLFSLDYLISQRIFPILDIIFQAEDKNAIIPNPFPFVSSPKNVFDSILQLSFDIYTEPDLEGLSAKEQEEVRKAASGKWNARYEKLQELNHYKELGRAAFRRESRIPKELLQFNIFKLSENQRENNKGRRHGTRKNKGSSNSFFNFMEGRKLSEYTRDLKRMTKIEEELKPKDGYGVFKCPCCGAKTLFVTDYPFDEGPGNEPNSEELIVGIDATCYYCTYQINPELEEPSAFGIMEENIFSVKSRSNPGLEPDPKEEKE